MTTTRFPNGIGTVKKADTLGMLGMPDPTKFHAFMDDFDLYVAADWVVTEVGVATQALADGDGGLLLITNAAADNNSSFQQKIGESFLFAAGKKLWFKAKFQVSDATQSDFVIGLQITDTTPLDVTDGVFFQKDDGDANLDFHVEKNNVATTATAIHTMVTATDVVVGFYYDGVSEIQYFIDGVHVGTSVTTNLPDDEALTISFGVQNGAAVAKTMTLDYVLAVKER